jgi:hypothetical protein
VRNIFVPAEKLQELIQQSDRDIADYVMAMDAMMQDEPLCAVEEWRMRREFWLSQLSR